MRSILIDIFRWKIDLDLFLGNAIEKYTDIPPKRGKER